MFYQAREWLADTARCFIGLVNGLPPRHDAFPAFVVQDIDRCCVWSELVFEVLSYDFRLIQVPESFVMIACERRSVTARVVARERRSVTAFDPVRGTFVSLVVPSQWFLPLL